METFQEQETKRKQKQKNRKDEKKSAAKNPKKESTTTVEYFDISDSSVDSYSTYGSDVEPDRDAPGTSAGGAKSSKMVARPDKAALTGWTNTPVPIGGGNENPCLKKQFVARQPQVPTKEHLAARGMIVPAERPILQTTATPGISALIPDSETLRFPEKNPETDPSDWWMAGVWQNPVCERYNRVSENCYLPLHPVKLPNWPLTDLVGRKMKYLSRLCDTFKEW